MYVYTHSTDRGKSEFSSVVFNSFLYASILFYSVYIHVIKSRKKNVEKEKEKVRKEAKSVPLKNRPTENQKARGEERKIRRFSLMEREREREKNKLHYFSSRAKKDFYLFHNEKERENVIKLFSCLFLLLLRSSFRG